MLYTPPPDYNRKFRRKMTWSRIVLIIIMLIVGMFAWFGCMTPDKATNYLKNKGKLAAACAEAFPVRDSIIVRDSLTIDTLYIPEAIEMGRDTIMVKGQPIPFFSKCPPPMVITKTIRHDSTIFRPDTALTKVISDQRNDLIVVNKGLMSERDEWKAKAKKSGRQKWITWILLFIGLAGGFILKLKKIF